jgi:hypothetical protein
MPAVFFALMDDDGSSWKDLLQGALKLGNEVMSLEIYMHAIFPSFPLVEPSLRGLRQQLVYIPPVLKGGSDLHSSEAAS